ncbi:MAG: TolC family outer membrane protein [Burkholderiaceae bacterium]|nr:TolC family outer membrane protein [Burkholderiaceae bacterium]
MMNAHAIGVLQAYEAALVNDPTYRSAISENQAGQQNKAIGRSGLLPALQYNFSASKNKGDTTAPNFRGIETTSPLDYTSTSNTISLRQTVFNLDTYARYTQGIAQTNYSNAQFDSRSQELIIRLVSAYADAKYAEEQYNLYVAQRDSYAEQKRINDRLFDKGEGTITDKLETQAKLDVSETQVLEAADNVANTRTVLGGIVGKEIMQLDGLLPDFRVSLLMPSSVAEWEEIAKKNNPEIIAGQYAIEISEQEIRKANAGHLPRVDFTANYNRGVSDSFTTRAQDNKIRSVGVQLVLPIYSGGYVNAVAAQAVANRDKARSDLDATTNRVIAELRKQFKIVTGSVAKIAALEKSVNSTTKLVEATKQSVKGGVRINLDVLNAQQQLVAAQRDLASARYTYLVSFLRLRFSAGVLSGQDLQTVAAYFQPST